MWLEEAEEPEDNVLALTVSFLSVPLVGSNSGLCGFRLVEKTWWIFVFVPQMYRAYLASVVYIYILDLYIPGTCLSSILGFEPSKRRPKLHSKQGAPFGFQVYIYIVNVNYIYI